MNNNECIKQKVQTNTPHPAPKAPALCFSRRLLCLPKHISGTCFWGLSQRAEQSINSCDAAWAVHPALGTCVRETVMSRGRLPGGGGTSVGPGRMSW